MFTGIVEEVGTIKSIKNKGVCAELAVRGDVVFNDIKLGDSIAVNGVCLTVTSYGKDYFTADVMHETLKRSSLGNLNNGSFVNLERAMSAEGRFGGHMVSGHIDGTGKIIKIKDDGNAVWYTIAIDKKLSKYIVEKGSVAIDGISLTVANNNETNFSVSIIPHTIKETVLGYKKVGDTVNIENDIVGKYVEKFLNISKDDSEDRKSNITVDFLNKYGF